jgi:hypothetical protein
MDTLSALNAKIFGKKTFAAMSMGLLESSHVDKTTESVAALKVFKFMKPGSVQETGIRPDKTLGESGNLTPRVNVEFEKVAEPVDVPYSLLHETGRGE